MCVCVCVCVCVEREREREGRERERERERERHIHTPITKAINSINVSHHLLPNKRERERDGEGREREREIHNGCYQSGSEKYKMAALLKRLHLNGTWTIPDTVDRI